MHTLLWFVLVLLTIDLAVVTTWFAYALLIEARFRSNLIPESWWERNPLGRLLLHAQRRPSLGETIRERRWHLLGEFGLTDREIAFLDQCTDEELASMLMQAAQVLAEGEKKQAPEAG